MAYDQRLIHTTVAGGVATAVIDAPPMNVMTAALLGELAAFCSEVEADVDVRVVVFRSADPDFFIAHFDVEAILAIPVDRAAARTSRPNPFHEMCERVRTMPKVTIAEIAGRVGGGGSEFAASCDMRFGALDKAVVNQMEVPLGILPGGTGTQRLPRLLGRGRALEVILGAVDLDAATAERWGYLNRALPEPELSPFVHGFARRIAGYPPGAVARATAAILTADAMDLREGLAEEAYLFQQAIRDPRARATMRRFLDLGGQTRGPELRMGQLVTEL
ncbi:MAG: enoyl-CoA hydratase/isomerase family protein [Acidimicrobiales bacterium]